VPAATVAPVAMPRPVVLPPPAATVDQWAALRAELLRDPLIAGLPAFIRDIVIAIIIEIVSLVLGSV